ncbi:hemopexin [Chanos chanos]|uniref:Hemopexin n=1 Tax=Chanos chanos TaxID=29144 RepID=A0A6J2WC53_CHACN|nr:hemopexin-like [Chanos chanos]
MKLLLCLCLALSLCLADHQGTHEHGDQHKDEHDRCKVSEFDAASTSEEGIPYFFKGDHVWKGFHGAPHDLKDVFPELGAHHHVDAAFRLHTSENHTHHDDVYIFEDEKVYVYDHHKLEEGYPKNIKDLFPGIPDHIDAAVWCPKEDCHADTIIFFKDHHIYHFDVHSHKTEEKDFKGMPNCTAAIHYLGSYYCFHGHEFSQFDPETGKVHGKYPKEIRSYFMRCSDFGDKTEEQHIEREQCSRVHVDALTAHGDDVVYAFRGHYVLSRDADKFHVDTIEKEFKDVHSEVDTVFTHGDHFHIVKGDQVYAYKRGEPHALMEGYPKPVNVDLGIEPPIEAAFICGTENIAYVIKDHKIYSVDVSVEPRAAGEGVSLPLLKKVDAAMCSSKGVTVVVGGHFYHYESPKTLMAARDLPERHRVAQELLGCDH